VPWAPLQRLEDEHVQRTLEQFDPILVASLDSGHDVDNLHPIVDRCKAANAAASGRSVSRAEQK
jgi:hypothetical protein